MDGYAGLTGELSSWRWKEHLRFTSDYRKAHAFIGKHTPSLNQRNTRDYWTGVNDACGYMPEGSRNKNTPVDERTRGVELLRAAAVIFEVKSTLICSTVSPIPSARVSSVLVCKACVNRASLNRLSSHHGPPVPEGIFFLPGISFKLLNIWFWGIRMSSPLPSSALFTIG